METDQDIPPAEWIEQHCSIVIPGKGIEPLRPYPYQVKLWGDASRLRLVLKSRQMGVSRALACEAAWTALTLPGSTVLLVSRGLEAARNLLRYAWQSIEPAVRSETIPRPTRRNTTALEWDAVDSRIVSLSASPDAARSYAATAVYLDEAAYLPWAEEIYQSLAPTVSTGGRMTVVSTPHGRGNLFHRLWEGEEGWSRLRIHWSERPGYTAEWAEQERKRHTARSWAEEYELSFESSGNSVFREEQIRALLLDQPPDAADAAPFSAGLDLARYNDYTALVVLDRAGRIAALERFNQASWTIQVDRVARTLDRFPGCHLICDATAAGDPVFGMLQARAAQSRPQLWTCEPFVYTHESRGALIEALVLAVEGVRIGIPRTEASAALLAEMRAFQWDTTPGGRARPGHPPGGRDDCIQALALAWRSLLEEPRRRCRTTTALTAVGHALPAVW